MRTLLSILFSCSALLLATSCGGPSKPLEPLALEDIPTEAKQAFEGCKPAVQQALDAALASLEKKQYLAAWDGFQALAAMPDLNKK